MRLVSRRGFGHRVVGSGGRKSEEALKDEDYASTVLVNVNPSASV